MWDYTETLKDHFFNPRNAGVIENPDAVGEVGSLACGDALRLMFNLSDNGTISDVKFQTFGCGSAIASASALTELIKGKTLAEAEEITNQDIVEFLGGLPEQKMHCSVMGREALEAAIDNYRTGSTEKHELEGNVVCTCFGVTDEEIKRVAQENNLKTVEQVTNYCKAGGGCGGCRGDIEEILQQLQREIPQPTADQDDKTIKQKSRSMTNIEKIKLIQQTLDQQVRPALQADGGDIELIDVVENRVIVAMRGMCAHCQVSEFTLAEVVRAKLHEFVSDELIVEELKT